MKSKLTKVSLTVAEQQQLEAEFLEDYGIELSRFDPQTGEPSYNLEQLQLLIYRLCDEIASNELEPGIPNADPNIVSACAIFEMKHGGLRIKREGRARIGQQLTNGETINDEASALGLARLNALRECCRAIGFNPLAAHRARRGGQEPPATQANGDANFLASQRQLHALAGELGLRRTGNDRPYREWLLTRFGVNTSAALNAEQIALACQSLRADLAVTHYQQRIAA